MHLESKEIIDHPLQEVFALVRDDLSKLVPYLPNVERIEVKKHAPKGSDCFEVVNHWYGKVEMPAMLKKFMKPEIFSWKDFATWKNNEFCVEYRLESFLANDLFDAKGTNSFFAVDENKTELKISCDVQIYPEKVPGVPRLLARKVTPMIESLLEKLLAPNLTSLGSGLKKYYQENE